MSKRILIVDDEHYIRLLLHRTLEDLEFEGVEIHAAEDGARGLEMARALRPDLIFLDLMMPGLSGAEVCTAVRRDPALAGTHVVILTAKGQLPAFAEDAAPHECMTKPFDPDRIVARAAEVLGVDLDVDL
ncbi:MAG: response regulator [bacterium]